MYKRQVLTVTDAFNKGDKFEVFYGAADLGPTSSVAVDASATTSDPAVTSLDNSWSHGVFNLGSSSAALVIQPLINSIDPVGGAAYFKVDFVCNDGFAPSPINPDTLTGFICIPIPPVVGGMGIPVDSTALLLAGVQGSALWMIPAIVVAGAGITIFKLKKKNKGETS